MFSAVDMTRVAIVITIAGWDWDCDWDCDEGGLIIT